MFLLRTEGLTKERRLVVVLPLASAGTGSDHGRQSRGTVLAGGRPPSARSPAGTVRLIGRFSLK